MVLTHRRRRWKLAHLHWGDFNFITHWSDNSDNMGLENWYVIRVNRSWSEEDDTPVSVWKLHQRMMPVILAGGIFSVNHQTAINLELIAVYL